MDERICIHCGMSPPEVVFYRPGQNVCTTCKKRQVTLRREKLKANKLCLRCSQVLDRDGMYCTICAGKYLDAYYANHTENLAATKQRRQRLKAVAFEAYGGPWCVCCGEVHVEFLTIDHRKGDGAAHRRQLQKERGWKVPPMSMAGSTIYLWLRQNNYPPGFQVLCMNCNFALGAFGYCPHTRTMVQETDS